MHSLTDFKNFALAELNLFDPLTVLLGKNGSGKTNLIEGVELLATLARGVPFNEITDIDRSGTFEVRGGLRSCIRFGSHRFQLRFNQATVRDKYLDYSIEIAIAGRTGVQLVAECLTIGDRDIFDAKQVEGDVMSVRYSNFSRGPNPTCTLSASRSVLSRYEEVIRNSRSPTHAFKESVEMVEVVRDYLRNAYIFDPQPERMRDYVRLDSAPQLLRTGVNLSAVLFSLKESGDEGRRVLNRITDIVRQIPEEPFAEIGFVETSLRDVMVGFVPANEKKMSSSQLVDARILSDGTLRMLAIITALETVPRQSRIIIEEFDKGLHPSRAKLLVQTLAESAGLRDLNVIVTTHNPAFMDALEESQLKSVLICHGVESTGGSKVTSLSELDIAGTIDLRGGLGDFVTRGALERYLEPDFAETRALKTQEWLASLS